MATEKLPAKGARVSIVHGPYKRMLGGVPINGGSQWRWYIVFDGYSPDKKSFIGPVPPANANAYMYRVVAEASSQAVPQWRSIDPSQIPIDVADQPVTPYSFRRSTGPAATYGYPNIGAGPGPWSPYLPAPAPTPTPAPQPFLPSPTQQDHTDQVKKDAADVYGKTRISQLSIASNAPLHSLSNGPMPRIQEHFAPGVRECWLQTADDVYNATSSNFDHRYRFTFLYNPTTWGYEMSADPSIDPVSQATSLVSNAGLPGMGKWGLEVFINRVADLRWPDKRFYTGASADSLADVVKRGTEHDVDYLFRTVNGKPFSKTTTGRTNTANTGYLNFNRVVLHIGQWNYIGTLTDITVNHIMMTPSMVPTISQVQFSFQQYMDTPGSTL